MPSALRLTAALLLWAAALPAADTARSVSILHSNDLHAQLLPEANGRGGLARFAAALRKERAGCNSCLFLMAGDQVQGTPVSTIFKGVPIYELLNALGIDAAIPGNHEFDYGAGYIPQFLKTARFPVLSANVTDGAGRLLGDDPYLVRTVNGVRIGILGVLTSSLPSLTVAERTRPWTARPVVESVRKFLPELRRRADLVVLLAHVTVEEEEAILRDLPEVSVTIAGHTHLPIAKPKTRAGRVLVRVRASARELGRLDLKFDRSAKAVVSTSWKRIEVDSIEPASDVTREVDRWERRVTEIVEQPIGVAGRRFAGRDLKLLMERATAEMMGVDFAYVGQGGIRAALPKGRLLARHVWNVYPFDNYVVVGRFKGSRLPAAVARGKRIDPDREYTLATNDFDAAHQDSPRGLRTSGLKFPRIGPLQRDLFLDWIRKRKTLE